MFLCSSPSGISTTTGSIPASRRDVSTCSRYSAPMRSLVSTPQRWRKPSAARRGPTRARMFAPTTTGYDRGPSSTTISSTRSDTVTRASAGRDIVVSPCHDGPHLLDHLLEREARGVDRMAGERVGGGPFCQQRADAGQPAGDTSVGPGEHGSLGE